MKDTIISFLIFVSTIFIHVQLLPLQRANLVFQQPELRFSDKKKLWLTMALKNMGKATAKNIEYKIYRFLDTDNDQEKINCDEKNNPIFNNKLINTIGSEDSQKFGYATTNSDSGEDYEGIIIAELHYEDNVFFIPKNKTQFTGWSFKYFKDSNSGDYASLTHEESNKYIECLSRFGLSHLIKNKTNFFIKIWKNFIY